MRRQISILKMIRKPMPPATRIQRPLKGRGYRRSLNKKEVYAAKE